MKLGWEQPRRVARIRDLSAEPQSATYPIPFQGTLRDIPIRTISLEMPKYRLNNGRTEAAQLQYLAANPNLQADFFTADLESDAAQTAQHEILSEMISEKDLLPYFRDHAQEEPLILTDLGFVLNGNRRLCAFRTLFAEDPNLFASFANIRVVVLPSGDEKDLDRLESRLQRERDLRADYPWYADAVKYRRRLKEFGEAELRAMEGVSKDHIVKHIEMLEAAESYLRYRGTPSQYALLSEGDGGGAGFYAFDQLIKGRAKFKNAEVREVFTYTCFAEMIKPQGRVYDTIPKLAEHFDFVQEALPRVEVDVQDPGNLDDFFGKENDNGVAPKLAYAKSFENSAQIREILQSTVAEREMIKRDTKKQNFVFEQVRRGTTFLKEAYNGIQDGTKRDGVDEQLREAEEYLKKLRAWVSEKQ